MKQVGFFKRSGWPGLICFVLGGLLVASAFVSLGFSWNVMLWDSHFTWGQVVLCPVLVLFFVGIMFGRSWVPSGGMYSLRYLNGGTSGIRIAGASGSKDPELVVHYCSGIELV